MNKIIFESVDSYWDKKEFFFINSRRELLAVLDFRFMDKLSPCDNHIAMVAVFSDNIVRKVIGSDRIFNEHYGLFRDQRRYLEKSGRRIFSCEDAAENLGEGFYNGVLVNLAGKQIDQKLKFLCPQFHDWFATWYKIVLMSLMCPEHPHAPLGQAMWKVFQNGFFPLRWRGQFPDGYAEVYALPGWSPDEVPPSCRPPTTALKFVRRRAPKRLPTPSVPVVSPTTWPTPGTGPRVQDAFARLWEQCCTTDAERTSVHAIASRVTRVRHRLAKMGTAGNALEITVRAQGDDEITITAQPPWTGKLTGLTLDLARVVRGHNGFEALLGPGKFVLADWYPFDGQCFDLDWEVWHQGDEDDAEDDFLTPPLVPLCDAGGIHLLHPTERTAEGVPRLDYWTHDGTRRPSLAPTAWSAFLEAIESSL